MAGDVCQRHAGDDSLATRRHVIQISAALRRACRAARDPTCKSRKLKAIRSRLIAPMQFETGQAIRLIQFVSHDVKPITVSRLTNGGAGGIQELPALPDGPTTT